MVTTSTSSVNHLVQQTVLIGTVTPFKSLSSLHPERTDIDSVTSYKWSKYLFPTTKEQKTMRPCPWSDSDRLY
jgi:hypothetical protein